MAKKTLIACIPSDKGGKKIQGSITDFEVQNKEVVVTFTPCNKRSDAKVIKFGVLSFPNHKFKEAAEKQREVLLAQ